MPTLQMHTANITRDSRPSSCRGPPGPCYSTTRKTTRTLVRRCWRRAHPLMFARSVAYRFLFKWVGKDKARKRASNHNLMSSSNPFAAAEVKVRCALRVCDRWMPQSFVPRPRTTTAAPTSEHISVAQVTQRAKTPRGAQPNCTRTLTLCRVG